MCPKNVEREKAQASRKAEQIKCSKGEDILQRSKPDIAKSFILHMDKWISTDLLTFAKKKKERVKP